MATDTYLVNAKTTVATQIVWAGDGPTLVANTSLTGTFWITENNAANVNDAQGIVPIGPNGSVVVDGTRDFWAITNSVAGVTISTISGGMSTFLGLTGGNGSLVLPSVFSPNYVPGVSGWSIKKDGSSEFSNVTVRGTFAGTDYIINANGEYRYSGTPAAGNLIYSDTNGTSDQFGNETVLGIGIYNPSTFEVMQIYNGGINVSTGTSQAGPYAIQQIMTWAGTSLGWYFQSEFTGDPSASFQQQVQFANEGSAPAGNAGYAVAFSDSVGNLAYVQDKDQQFYLCGSRVYTTSATIQVNSVSAVNIFAPAVGATSYHFELCIVYIGNQSAGTPVISYGGTAVVSGVIGVGYFDSAAGGTGGQLSQVYNGAFIAQTGPALVLNGKTAFEAKGTVTFSAGGTFTLFGTEGTSGDSWAVAIGSYLKLTPIG